MVIRNSTTYLIAVFGVVLLWGAGCATKGTQTASEGEFATSGSAEAGTTGAAGAGPSSLRGQGESGFSEQEIGDGVGQLGSGGADGDPFSSSDLAGGGAAQGPDGSMESEDFASSQEPFPSFDAGRSGSGQVPLGGFGSVEPGQPPLEDRVQDGTMIAKIEPSDSYQERLESLRREREGTTVGELKDIFFRYDSWRISEGARTSLRDNAAWLRANPSQRLTIEGHCDERGSAAYNLVLGEKRAKAVRNYLLELGIRPERVMVVSYGKERPFCHERNETCYQLNRRGHFAVRP